MPAGRPEGLPGLPSSTRASCVSASTPVPGRLRRPCRRRPGVGRDLGPGAMFASLTTPADSPDRPLPRELGNKFALVLLHLPTGAMSPLDRLQEVHRRKQHIKDSPEVIITSTVAEGIGRLHAVEQPLVDFFAGKVIGVTTNVIGPREPRYLAGAEVTGVLGWAPGSGRQTLGGVDLQLRRDGAHRVQGGRRRGARSRATRRARRGRDRVAAAGSRRRVSRPLPPAPRRRPGGRAGR